MLDELIEKLKVLKVKHYECEDCWYSCPKSEEGCCNDGGSDCTCGADNRNKEVDALITWVRDHSDTLDFLINL